MKEKNEEEAEDIKRYTSLLALPLFQGLGRRDLEEVVAHTKFEFSKSLPNECIVAESEICNQLRFIINGEVTVKTEADDHGYRIIEEITAPEIIQPERIFGLRQRYSHSVYAKTPCAIMSIDKNDVMNLSDKYTIFRINLMNYISTKAQKGEQELWRQPPTTLSMRITRFLEQRCIRPAGKKTIYIKMTRLADELNDSRLDISRALNEMEGQGLLELHRGRIEVPALEELILKK